MGNSPIKIWFNKESAISGKDPWKVEIGEQTHFVSQIYFLCKVATKARMDSPGTFHSWLEVVSSDFVFEDNILTIK